MKRTFRGSPPLFFDKSPFEDYSKTNKKRGRNGFDGDI